MTRRMWNETIRICTAVTVCLLMAGSGISQTTATSEAALSKQLAIMSRIMEKQLGEEFKDRVITSSMLQRGVQGFYVRGVGAIFFVDMKFPVAKPPAKEKPAGPSKPNDLWDRFEQEMEGTGSAEERSRVGVGYSLTAERMTIVSRQPYEEAKVERLKSVVFNLLAEYGRRLEALADNERIILVISGSLGPTVLSGKAVRIDTGSGRATARGELRALSDEAAIDVAVGPRSVVSLESSEYRTVLTISVMRKDLQESAGELAKRAVVNAYTD